MEPWPVDSAAEAMPCHATVSLRRPSPMISGDGQALAFPRRTAGIHPDMSAAKQLSRLIGMLSDAALTQASSAAIFLRGVRYAADGTVTVLGEDPLPEPGLQAQVDGSDTYCTEVWIEHGAVAGDCDCPNARDGWFCKHQVAVALVWRDRLAGKTAPAVAATAPGRAAKGGSQSLRDFLHSRPAPALADKLLALAAQDRDLARELQQWQLAAEGDTDPAALQALVSKMLAPGRAFIDWDQSLAYVRRADAVLPLLQQARARDPEAALLLCQHALRRAWVVLQQADDSNGDIGGLCQALGAEWLLSLQAAGARPAAFGDTYLQLQLDDPFGCYDADAADAAIGKAAMARYRLALAERWRRAKDTMLARRAAQAAGRKRGAGADDTSEPGLWTLERLHLAQLERAGQVDEMLALLREDLSEPPMHSGVIELLERHGRFREAFAQAEQACKVFPDDRRLQDALLRCYERDGWVVEALALRRRQFVRAPGVATYHAVLKAGEAAGQDVAVLRQSLIDSLPTRAGAVRDVTLHAAILGSEGRWTEACALVQPPAVCRADLLAQIARHLPTRQKDAALALLLRVFSSTMQRSSSPYQEALALVADIGQRMGVKARAAWLAELRSTYKAKRNFIRDLPLR